MTLSVKQMLLGASLLVFSLFLAACNPLESKAKAALQVETGEVPASLFLDDQYLEKTPFINKEIKPGTYTLKIQPDDTKLASYETEIDLRKGLLTVVTWLPGARPELSGGVIYELEKINDQKNAELTLVSIPDSAILKVADREKEFAPVTIFPITPGEKEFEVSLPSYDSQKHTVNLLAGYRTTITIKLAKTSLTGSATSGTSSDTSPTKSATPSAQIAATTSGRVANSPQPTAKPSASPTSRATTGTAAVPPPKVTIKATNFFQDGEEVLRVRKAANASGETLGFAPVGSEYPYLGETVGGWRKIEFETETGWVSGQYVTLTE